MNCFLAQANLLARNGDGKDWYQVLFVVALAIFYAVGSVLKAKKSKAEQKGDEQLARKPARKPPEGTEGLQKQPLQQLRRPAGPSPSRQYRPQIQPPRRKVMRPQPVVQKPAAKLEQEIEFETIEPLEALKLPPLAALEEYKEFIGEPLKKLEDLHVGVSPEIAEPEAAIEPLLDYADTDELKRAILHYEILGRPLSLRGPSEHIIGL
jgi:hypothetical protein